MGRPGRSLDFEPHKERIVADEEANELLSRQYREEGHWGTQEQ
jgi:hypothetical protein